ncbi:nucleoside triphosphate pyrophosphohydrolase [Rossellomorea vietnamensis]|uniref:Nucleoside triphosphate pyrophosphohydrolase n=1 Tax=Rossellomorea vietnamensis TaxID=218284 RepID=A0A5D4M991_9BACI|nr:nucleoside triphosphate pyrophosphohydrolase [Rossellomorea vietnamensis]TYR97540.1 nucleoside triphosphate pyrophosphohydrolase [Rossellomorea vietnamensis]
MNKIMVAGLGAGELDQMPLGVYKQLKGERTTFLRTEHHPVVSELKEEGFVYQSFDYIYEKHDSFDRVYIEIVEVLKAEAQQGEVLYAVPGHPLVAEKTVQLLIEAAEHEGFELEILGGQSFLDPLFAAVKADPIEGFQLLDGTDLHLEDIKMDQHLIIGQVYDAFTASDVKLTLMEIYPYDYRVKIVTAAGTKEEIVKTIPLVELDREVELNNLTSLYVPPAAEMDMRYKQFSTFRHIIARLRGPGGCPWDIEQTHHSLKKYLIEETYELLEAIEEEDIDHIIEELGDVLLQIMLHAQIGEDEGMFTINEVIGTVSEKMVRRHPHVFGDVTVEGTDDVKANWETIKQAEKGEREKPLLSGAAKGYPSLMKAYEYQKKAAKTGFDWELTDEAWEKVYEEIEEFRAEAANGDRHAQISEFGDLLFSLVNIARFYKVHPEEALAMANTKFFNRFSYVEQKVKESGKEFSDFSLKELDGFWNEAKGRGIN